MISSNERFDQHASNLLVNTSSIGKQAPAGFGRFNKATSPTAC
jgi:hypothetical protein